VTAAAQGVEAVPAAFTQWLGRQAGAKAAVSGWDRPANGFSNQTVCFDAKFEDASGRLWEEPLVLRIGATGPSLFLDADVQQQWRIMKAVAARTDVPVPNCRWIEPNSDLFGAPFFVMDRVAGRVPPDLPACYSRGWLFDARAADRRKAVIASLQALAALHRQTEGSGFAFLQRSEGATPLQAVLSEIARWYRWVAGDRRHPVVEKALDYLRESRPETAVGALSWGDSRLGNIVFDPSFAVASVLDWEMAMIGPPEMDLGWWLMFERRWTDEVGVNRPEGIPSRQETIDLYGGFAGRPVENIEYYEILAAVRLAVVVMRAVDIQAARGEGNPNTDLGVNSTVSRMLASMLGLPPTPVSKDQDAYLALYQRSN
jgi:aminoglycoside phosphotransferase (APT) family kinase protein